VAIPLAACGGATQPVHSVAATATPVLGSKSASPTTEGFAAIRPSNISFGGDSTSGVSSITWESWGGPRAVGAGVGVWVWPGTCTGCNKPSRARVVAFAARSCNGHFAYTRLEWYFPEYGEQFDASRGIPICTQAGAITPTAQGAQPVSTQCPPALLKNGGVATEVTAEEISCPHVAELLHRIPGGPYKHERRFLLDGFRCGTEGSLSTAMVSCGLGHEYVTFSVPVR
jgi:hypothetical protein